MLLSIGAEVRRRGQLDEALLPSPEATGILREAGWSAERRIDISRWIADLARQGTAAFPAAEAILSNCGGLVVKHTDQRGSHVTVST
jgi:hypothetical protein